MQRELIHQLDLTLHFWEWCSPGPEFRRKVNTQWNSVAQAQREDLIPCSRSGRTVPVSERLSAFRVRRTWWELKSPSYRDPLAPFTKICWIKGPKEALRTVLGLLCVMFSSVCTEGWHRTVLDNVDSEGNSSLRAFRRSSIVNNYYYD